MEATSGSKTDHQIITEQPDPGHLNEAAQKSDQQLLLSRLHVALALIILFTAFFLAQYDRFILSYFQLAITKDLQISSTEYAILSGYATGVSFAILSVPLAYISDRGLARVWTLTVSIIWWSLCVIFQGMSGSYWQLACARVGMGIGQSAVEALSVSLISDLMGPRRYVTTGEGVLYVGIYIGEAISGQISTAFRKTGTSWRWAMKGVGIFGIGVGLAVRVILYREPQRREGLMHGNLGIVSPASARRSLKRAIRHVVRMKSFWLFALSAGVRTLSGVVFGYYMPGYLQQLYPESVDLMSIYGIIVGAVGSVAALSGGFITSLTWEKTKLTPLYLVSVGGVLSSVFVLMMIFSRDIAGGSADGGKRVLYGSMAAAYITAELWLGPISGLLVLMIPPELKTSAFSIYSALTVLIYSSGPEIVGLALRHTNSQSAGYVDAIKVILAVIIPLGYVLSSIGFAFCLPLTKRDLGLICTGATDITAPASKRRKFALASGFAVILAMVVVLFVLNIVYRA